MPKLTREPLSRRSVDAAKAAGKTRRLRDATVPGLVLRVSPTGSKSWASNPTPHGVNDAYALLCRLFPDQIIELLKAEIEAAYSRGVTIADDKERAKLEAKLGELERQEEVTIRAAAAAGLRIARRADVNPEVLLAA